MAQQRVVHQRAQGGFVILRRGPLEGPYADVTRRHAREHRALQRSLLAPHVFARRRHRKAAGRRDAERVCMASLMMYSRNIGPSSRQPADEVTTAESGAPDLSEG